MWKMFLLPFTLLVMLAVGKCEMTCPAFDSGRATSVSNNFYTITRDSEGYVQLDAEFTSVEELQAAVKALEDSEHMKQILDGECHNEVSTTITVKEGIPPAPTTTTTDNVETTSANTAPDTPKSVTSQTIQASTSTSTTKYDDTNAPPTTDTDDVETTATSAASKTLKAVTSRTSQALTSTPKVDDTTSEPTTTFAETSQMTTPEPCIKNYSSNSSCNFTYDGKCFRFLMSEDQDVDYAKAKQMCNEIRFQLGNITDDCLFNALKKHVTEKRENYQPKAFSLWTGMNVTTMNAANYKTERNHWLNEQCNIDRLLGKSCATMSGKGLQIRIKRFANSDVLGLGCACQEEIFQGAFCEKQ